MINKILLLISISSIAALGLSAGCISVSMDRSSEILAQTSGSTTGGGSTAGSTTNAAGIPVSSLGLSKTALEDTAEPLQFTYQDSKSVQFNRYSPPTIPHEIGDFIPITNAINDCIDCHQIPKKKRDDDPVPLPPSHYINHRTGVRTATAAAARYNCTACHVPASDAPPLVGNSFQNWEP